MNARNRIWEELKQTKANILCAQMYTDRKRLWNRRYNATIAILAGFGALGFAINEYIPFITSLLVGTFSIIKSLIPTFSQTEAELSEMDAISDFYAKYMNSLEEIWYRLDTGEIKEKEAMDDFFKLKESECDKESKLNRGTRSISKRLQDKVNGKAKQYIDDVYFTKTE